MATTLYSPLASTVPTSADSSFTGQLSARDTMQGPVAIRRRPTQSQGHALEILGHAIEYLVDSRVVSESGNRIEYNRDAVELLSRSSREIFDGCAVVVPLGDRLKQWLYGPSRKAA